VGEGIRAKLKIFAHPVGPAPRRSSIGQNVGFLGEPIMSSYVLSQTIPIKALLGAISVAGTLTTISPSSIVGAMLWAGYLGNVVVSHFT
jgi:hypothetical protein